MKELGEKLKNTRIDRKLDIDDLHDRTKIPINTIRSIEEGEPVKIEKTYYRIFVRAIAAELDLNGDQLLKELDTREEKQRENGQVSIESIKNGGGFKDFLARKRRLVILNGLALLFVAIAYGYIRYGKQLFIEPDVQKIQELKNEFQTEGLSLPDTLKIEPFELRLIALKTCTLIAQSDNGQIEHKIVHEEEEIFWQLQRGILLSIDKPRHVLMLINEYPLNGIEGDTVSGMNFIITADGVVHQSIRECNIKEIL